MKTPQNDDQIYEAIGKRIKTAREKAGLSQKQLAESIGFESGTAISLLESADRKVDISVLEKIANILKTDINYLLGKETQPLDISYALRADKQLTTDEKKQILDFVDFIKKKKSGN